MIQFTVITDNQRPIAKGFKLAADRSLKSLGTRAHTTDGTVARIECATLREVINTFDNLTDHQAVCYGITEAISAPLVTVKALAEPEVDPTAIARSKQFFEWSDGPSIMMVDHDPAHNGKALTGTVLRDTLIDAVPSFKDAAMAARPSCSSHIWRSEGADGEAVELKGAGGMRLYIVIKDGALIPDAAKAIYEYLWVAGHGRYVPSKSGSLLDRNVIDAAVYRANGLDLPGKVELGEGLERRAPGAEYWNDTAEPFDLSRIKAPRASVAARAKANREDARKAAQGFSGRVRKAFIDENAEPFAKRHGLKTTEARRQLQSIARTDYLPGHYLITLGDDTTVSVADVLADSERYDRMQIPDPIDPNYGPGEPDKRIAKLYLTDGGDPRVFSFAHGGSVWNLCASLGVVTVTGDNLSDAAAETLALLGQGGRLYRGDGDVGGPLWVDAGRAHQVTHEILVDVIQENVTLLATKQRGNPTASNPRQDFLNQVLGSHKGRNALPVLRAVVHTPILRPDGSVVQTPGYDAQTRLFYAPGDAVFPKIPTPRGDDYGGPEYEAAKALMVLQHPFRTVPFADPVARSVYLTAVLTAVARGNMDKAPVFIIDSPVAGTGKSKLCACLQILAGSPVSTNAMPGGNVETAKLLLALAIGGAQSVVFDNCTGQIGNDALNRLVTSDVFSDRELGKTNNLSVSSRMLIVANGNGVTPRSDFARRCLSCHLDAWVRQPSLTIHAFDFEAEVRDNREKLASAALTILSAYLVANQSPGKGLASFDQWNDLVMGAMNWVVDEVQHWAKIMGEDPREYADPLKSTRENLDDEYREAVSDRDVLELLRNRFDGEWFTVNDIVSGASEVTFDGTGEMAFDMTSGVHRDDIRAPLGAMLKPVSVDVFNKQSVGRWLSQLAKRPTEPWRLDRRIGTGNKSQHRVVAVSVAPTVESGLLPPGSAWIVSQPES